MKGLGWAIYWPFGAGTDFFQGKLKLDIFGWSLKLPILGFQKFGFGGIRILRMRELVRVPYCFPPFWRPFFMTVDSKNKMGVLPSCLTSNKGYTRAQWGVPPPGGTGAPEENHWGALPAVPIICVSAGPNTSVCLIK